MHAQLVIGRSQLTAEFSYQDVQDLMNPNLHGLEAIASHPWIDRSCRKLVRSIILTTRSESLLFNSLITYSDRASVDRHSKYYSRLQSYRLFKLLGEEYEAWLHATRARAEHCPRGPGLCQIREARDWVGRRKAKSGHQFQLG